VAQGNRDLVAAFDLKKRPYLGPTSMDNELALVMANMVLAGKGKLCFDPFVGTGSILVVRLDPCGEGQQRVRESGREAGRGKNEKAIELERKREVEGGRERGVWERLG